MRSTAPVLFLYAGQGSQYARMTSGLFAADAVFRETLFCADRRVKRRTGRDIVDTIYGAADAWLSDLAITHPAIFGVQWAATRALEARGLRPDAVMGASLGEYVALCAAGVYRFEDMLDLVCDQAQSMLDARLSGAMLTILADAALFDREPALFSGCALAAVNFPGHFVVSGEAVAITRCENVLAGRGVTTHRLPVAVGFHSPMIDAVADTFHKRASLLDRRHPRIPCFSTTRAGDVAGTDVGAAHLWSVARDPIRFADTLRHTNAERPWHYVDLSPSATLATFVKYGQLDIAAERMTALTAPGDTTSQLAGRRLDSIIMINRSHAAATAPLRRAGAA